MVAVHLEGTFESFIARELTQRGWIQGNPGDWNRELALDTVQMFAFLADSQPKQWAKLSGVHGAKMEERFLGRLSKELDARGTELPWV